MSEGELVQRVIARDELAVRAMLRGNNRGLFRIARGILPEPKCERQLRGHGDALRK
jgi:hypothetical protein